MTKFQTKQVSIINVYLANNMVDTAARSLSSLIRSAMTKKSQDELWAIAIALKLASHPDFIA
jgi:hypothetical protein